MSPLLLTLDAPFVPRELGAVGQWGLLVDGVGVTTLEVQASGEWVAAAQLDAPGAYFTGLTTDDTYRVTTTATRVFLI